MKKEIAKTNLYEDIKDILAEARNKVYKAVNFTMVEAYWNIGKRIVEEEQKGKKRAGYGKHLIIELAKRLTIDFDSGFSEQSLWNMRRFYSTFPILSTVWRELTWSHYRLLIRVENECARKFYGDEAVHANWSVRALERQINSLYYERLLSSREKKQVLKEAENNTKQLRFNPRDFIKEPYVLEFLNLKDDMKYHERDIEQALVGQLQKFLLELGKGFSFVGRQQRISTETKEFYIDLVFYNYILKCFVLIDLKVGELTHQDIGQMDMYVRMYEDKMKHEGDNPTIGIILCAEKDETIVKYSVMKENKRLFASKYKLYLPTEQELINELEREKQQLKLIANKKK
jgi:predicted nuclease of restriction endonuclease-like (RecB) superfamily